MVDSNHRRRSRRFYSPLAPPESPPLTSTDALRGAIAGAAVRYASVAAGFRGRKCHGRGLKGHGRGRWERLRRPSSPDSGPWPATSGCRLTVAVALLTRVLPVILAEGVGDALVRGGGLPVDAVGVDLEQDCDAVLQGVPSASPIRYARTTSFWFGRLRW